MSLQERLYIDPASLLDALHYAAILFLAAYLSQSLHLVNAYWMTFTCAAILQGKFTFCDAAKCATDSRYESRFVAFCNFINDSLYTFTNNRYH